MNDMLFNNRNKIKDKMLAYGMTHAILFRQEKFLLTSMFTVVALYLY